MNTRSIIKALTPPLALDAYRRHTNRSLRFSGHPADWSEALQTSSGYAADNILERVTQATREVVAGRALYERDSVLMDEPDYPFAVLAAAWRAAAAKGGHLDVVDFGGSLGSSYRLCRPFLSTLQSLRWQVIEQPSFVAAGQAEFTTDGLSFHESVRALPSPIGARLILASGVLQYLEDPYAVLDSFAALSADHLVIDRTPQSDQSVDRLCIQHVPKQIYAGSYPCRILSRRGLLTHLQKDWTLVCDYACGEGRRTTDDGLPFEFRGLILDRKH